MRLSFLASEVRGGLRRNATMTIALVVSVAVSLTLFGTALLMRAQVDRMKGYWYDKIEVSIFLCGPNSLAYTCTGAVTDAQREAVLSDNAKPAQGTTNTGDKKLFEEE